jgi:hypothetical protein
MHFIRERSCEVHKGYRVVLVGHVSDEDRPVALRTLADHLSYAALGDYHEACVSGHGPQTETQALLRSGAARWVRAKDLGL